MTQIQMIDVYPKELKELPTKNPNVMEPELYAALVNSIKTDGFLQPVLVVEEGGEYVIIDGIHRTKAAVECGLSTIPAVLASDRARAEVLRIALNKTRGELDVTEVSRQLQTLVEEGFSKEDLLLTGFQEWEITTMLDNMDLDEDFDLTGAVTSPIEPVKPKTYALNFKFNSESERARVKEALEESGDGNALAGLLFLVSQASNYDQE